MHVQKIRLFGVISAVIALLLLAAIPVHAQDSGLQITPTKTIINAKPGETKQLSLEVKPLKKAASSFVVSFYNFTATDETGEPKVTEDTAFANGLSQWLSGPTQYTMTADETTHTYNFAVTVPNEARNGTYYGIISTKLIGDNSQDVSVGSLLLVNVGTVTQTVAIEEFDTSAIIKNNGIITGDFGVRVKNTGTGYSAPTIKIEILDDTKAVIDTMDVNKAAGGILPGTIRRYGYALNKDLDATKTYQVKVTVQAETGKPQVIEQELVANNKPAETPVNTNKDAAADNSYIIPAIGGLAIFIVVLSLISYVTMHKRAPKGTILTPQPMATSEEAPDNTPISTPSPATIAPTTPVKVVPTVPPSTATPTKPTPQPVPKPTVTPPPTTSSGLSTTLAEPTEVTPRAPTDKV